MRERKLIVMLAAVMTLFISCDKKIEDNYRSDPESTVHELREALGRSKTYMIQYEVVNRVENAVGTTLSTQWVDVKNDKMVMESSTETVQNGYSEKHEALTISDKGMFYMINLSDRTGMKSPTDYSYNDMMNEDSEESRMTFRAMIEQDGGRVLGNEEYLGLDCLVTELVQPDGEVVRMWFYKGIPLRTESTNYRLRTLKYEEGIKFPKNKLKIPEGIDFR